MTCSKPVILFLLSLLSALFFNTGQIAAQAYQGYTLFGPNNSRNTYLVDMNNTVVKSWTHSKNGGYSAYLLPDGSVLRTASSGSSSLNGGGAQGVVQKYSWNGALTWEYTYSTSTYRAHHDIEPMPNGNVLIIAWESKTAAQAVQAGLNHSATIWPDHIIEVQPVGTTGGNIVWQWHAWDHLIQDYDPTKSNYGVVGNHPELFDINVESAGSGDWLHINGISYILSLDQIVISSHELDEIYVIDHSTTTQEAAGHTGGNMGKGGDILYRWGRPSNYRAPGSQIFNVVHCAFWIPDSLPGGGNIMAFNNREGQSTSMVVEIVPPRDISGQYVYTPGTAYGPSSAIWSYTGSGFYSNHLGGCQRLPNGNTLIVESTSGYMFEVNQSGNTVWSYNRGGEIVRALRYGINYSGVSNLVAKLNLTTLVEGLFNGNIMVEDTVTVEIRNGTSPYGLVDQAKIKLNSLGNGTANFYYPTDATNYYIAIKHRNSIETWSKYPQQFSNKTLVYDFTSASTQAYGDNMIQKGTKWCLFSGDVNFDGIVDISDIAFVDNDNLLFVTGYTLTDINGDNLVDISDLLNVASNSINFVSKQIPNGF